MNENFFLAETKQGQFAAEEDDPDRGERRGPCLDAKFF